MINPQWFQLPMSRTNLHGHKNVRVIEVRLFFVSYCFYKLLLSYFTDEVGDIYRHDMFLIFSFIGASERLIRDYVYNKFYVCLHVLT